jgi:ribosomal protein L17
LRGLTLGCQPPALRAARALTRARLLSAAAEGVAALGGVANGCKWTMMRHGKKIHRLGRPADQRKALLRALTTQILTHGAIKTTKQKAKAVRPWVDKMIVLAKEGGDAKRQQARVARARKPQRWRAPRPLRAPRPPRARRRPLFLLRRHAAACAPARRAARRRARAPPGASACGRAPLKPCALDSRAPRRAAPQAAAWLYDKSVVDSIFEEVPSRYAERRNDFTKMFPTLARRGDNAQMVRPARAPGGEPRAGWRADARLRAARAGCAGAGVSATAPGRRWSAGCAHAQAAARPPPCRPLICTY